MPIQGRDRHSCVLRRPAVSLLARHEREHGWLRQYFPKGSKLSRWTAEEIEAVAHTLNTPHHKSTRREDPAEGFNEQLKLIQLAGVASTG